MSAENPTQIHARVRHRFITAPPLERGKFPARLHLLLAKDAKVGLVIRRGPSKSVCTVCGARPRHVQARAMDARPIYERRCDCHPMVGASFTSNERALAIGDERVLGRPSRAFRI